MIFSDDKRWDGRWNQINAFSMEYETAVIPFSATGYLKEFYDFYEIKNKNPALVPSEAGFYENLKEICEYDDFTLCFMSGSNN